MAIRKILVYQYTSHAETDSWIWQSRTSEKERMLVQMTDLRRPGHQSNNLQESDHRMWICLKT